MAATLLVARLVSAGHLTDDAARTEVCVLYQLSEDTGICIHRLNTEIQQYLVYTLIH